MAGVSRMAASMLAGDMPIRPGARDTLRLARGETLLRVAWVPREIFADAHELQCWNNHALALRQQPVADCARYDTLRRLRHGTP